MYDSRPASFPAPKAESWSVPTNVAQATMPASAHAAFAVEHDRRQGVGGAAVSHDAIDATTSLANSTARVRRGACGQSQRGTEMTSASDDQEVEREQHRSRRQDDDRRAMAGTATVCAGDERIRREAEEREAGKSCQLRGRRSSCEHRKQPGGCRRDGQRQHRSLDAPRGRRELGDRPSCRAAGGAVDVGAVVTATGHTVGLHRPASLPPAGDFSSGSHV